jgi:Flp pilus assembly pilin Flp
LYKFIILEVFEMNILKRFVKDEKGMETLAALIVAGLIGVITTLGGNVLTAFTSLSTATSGS